MMNTMVWIWLGIMAVSIFVEAATMSLVSTWFALGALAAAVAAYYEVVPAVQFAIFIIVALITLLLARPLAKKFLDPKIVPTNADRVIGMTAYVVEAINNDREFGAVKVDGKVWTARSEDNYDIPEGTQVEVCRIQGIKLYVRPMAGAVVGMRSH